MSWTLFKANIKANRSIWILMTIIFSFYLYMIVTMYDPKGIDALNEMLEMLPESLISALGFAQFGTSLLTFITGYIYGFLIFLFPMVVSITVNYRLIGRHVDSGSMAYLLSTPNSRKKIVVTQAVFSLASITALLSFSTLFVVLLSQAMFPGELEIGKFLLLNLYALLTYYALGGIGFLASCMFDESRYSLGLGTGLPIAFIALQMLGNAGDKVAWIGKLSLFALFDPEALITGDSFATIAMLILAILATALYLLAIRVFDKRSLPL